MLNLEITDNTDMSTWKGEWTFWKPPSIVQINVDKLSSLNGHGDDIKILAYNHAEYTIVPHPEKALLRQKPFPVIISRKARECLTSINDIFSYSQWMMWVATALRQDMRVDYISEPLMTIDFSREKANPLSSYHIVRQVQSGSIFEINNALHFNHPQGAKMNHVGPLLKRCLGWLGIYHDENASHIVPYQGSNTAVFSLDYKINLDPQFLTILNHQVATTLLNGPEWMTFKFLKETVN